MAIFWTRFHNNLPVDIDAAVGLDPCCFCPSAKDLFADSHGGLAPIPQAVPPLDTGTASYWL